MNHCIMDIPTAWEWTRSHPDGHDPKCSWVQAGMLCDCDVLWMEYNRRLAAARSANV